MSRKLALVAAVGIAAFAGRNRIAAAANSPRGLRARRNAKAGVQKVATTGATLTQRATEKVAVVVGAAQARRKG